MNQCLRTMPYRLQRTISRCLEVIILNRAYKGKTSLHETTAPSSVFAFHSISHSGQIVVAFPRNNERDACRGYSKLLRTNATMNEIGKDYERTSKASTCATALMSTRLGTHLDRTNVHQENGDSNRLSISHTSCFIRSAS